jgi:hypothetical protein
MTEADTRPADLGPWGDLSQFVGLRRTAGLALSPDGSRLVAVVQEINDGRSEWVPSLWEIPLDGASPYRLTDSPYGAASPAFLPDNSLVYVSGQPWPDPGAGGGPALWLLAEGQPPRPLARRPGGLTAPLIARDSGAMVAVGQRLSGSTAENDAARLVVRRDRRISAVLQTWMPVRDPFRDLDIEYPQLLFTRSPRAMSPCADLGWRDLAPDAGKAMVKVNPLTLTERSISADGDRIAAMWSTPGPRGAFPYSVVLIETATGKRTALAPHSDLLYTSPKIAPDGRRIASTVLAGPSRRPSAMGCMYSTCPSPTRSGRP